MFEQVENLLTAYPPSTDWPPGDFPIRVLLHGLLVSAFNNKEQRLEVGSLNPVPEKHSRELRVFERLGAEVPGSPFRIEADDIIQLKFDPAGVVPGMRKVQPSGTFDKQNADPHDFRWVLDFEQVYGTKLRKIPAAMKPRFFLYNGVVHSLLRSSVLAKSEEPFRRIAQVMAIDIDFPAGAPADLKAVLYRNKDAIFTFDLTRKHNVVFQNTCRVPRTERGAADLDKLQQTYQPPPGRPYFTFANAESNERVELNIRDEISRVRGPLRDRSLLNGLNDIYGLPGDPDFHEAGPEFRVDPCGMGYFGSSDGLDDEPEE